MTYQLSFVDDADDERDIALPRQESRDKKQALLQALPLRERPTHRVNYGAEDCSILELLAALVGGQRQMEVASALIARFGSIRSLSRATVHELTAVLGVGHARAAVTEGGGHFLDLHRIFSDEVFRDRSGHLAFEGAINGPVELAKQLAPSVVSLVESARRDGI